MSWQRSMHQLTSAVFRILWNRKALQSLMQCHTPKSSVNYFSHCAISPTTLKPNLSYIWGKQPVIASKVAHSKLCSPHSRSKFSLVKSQKNEDGYRRKDQMEPHYDLIYKSTFYNHLQLAYGIAGLGSVWLAGIFSCDLLGFPIIGITQEFLDKPTQGAVLAVSYVAFAWAIFIITHRYIVRMYYSEVEDQFVAIMTGLLPYTKRKIVIHPGTAVPTSSSWMAALMPWYKDVYKAPVQKVIMFSHHFRYPVYFNKILGYDA